MRHSTERFALNVVLWLIKRYLFDKYRLVTPAELEAIVNDYLAELPKLGIKLVYQDNQVGESNEQLKDSSGNSEAATLQHV